MEIAFSQSKGSVEAYDFVEVMLSASPETEGNAFTDVVVGGWFQREGGPQVETEGFCDALDGSLYRIRFMPSAPGRYRYSVTWRGRGLERTHTGSFRATKGKRRGLVRVDSRYPWHMVWEGTGEHYFYNGTTAYWLMGWDDETIRANIERLHRLKVTRIRAALSGRVKDGRAWYENVFPTERFSFLLSPWVAARPDDLENPGHDVARFNVPYWQKWERMLRYARDRDLVISVVFYVDGARPGVDPFGKQGAAGEDERRYYRYAAARFAAFSNVMWDITNEYQLFRDEQWANTMGAFLRAQDPYHHMTSVHGHSGFPFRTSPWADFAMYQCWDEHGGHEFMLRHRALQAETGRPMPQVNEEYGYEDHYPVGWGEDRKPPSRSADNRRRLAWGMYMAGGYQTTGERANTGTGWGPDTGGGWVNGRGDDSMVMLEGYAHIVDFFRAFAWWRTEPRDDLVHDGNMCLAEPGQQYAIYLPRGGRVKVTLGPGRYQARWFNPGTGAFLVLPEARGPTWESPPTPDGGDWAVLLVRRPSGR